MKEHNKAREKRYLAKVKTETETKTKVMVLSRECSSFPHSFQSLLTLLLCFSFVMGSPLSLGFFYIFCSSVFSHFLLCILYFLFLPPLLSTAGVFIGTNLPLPPPDVSPHGLRDKHDLRESVSAGTWTRSPILIISDCDYEEYDCSFVFGWD